MTNPASFTDEDATKILAHNGKSFKFASAFLSHNHAKKCARLYAFCRRLDDIADDCETGPDHARQTLKNIDRQLLNQAEPDVWVKDFLNLAHDNSIDISVARDLLAGVLSDLDQVRLVTEAELIRYCYAVAGTVGLMMCDVFGVKNPVARPFAIDLGIAMQMTNIARDIQEDAGNDRRYLPGQWMSNTSPNEICNPSAKTKAQLQNAVERLLDLADTYYESALHGFVYLPSRSRLSILVASTVYREIGVKLRKQGCKTWEGRVTVGKGRKLALACKALWDFKTNPMLSRPTYQHNASLHSDLIYEHPDSASGLN